MCQGSNLFQHLNFRNKTIYLKRIHLNFLFFVLFIYLDLELMITGSSQSLIPKNPSRHSEFTETAERMEEKCSVPVESNGRQTHSENAFLAPLEIDSSNVVVASQRIWHSITVAYSPRFVQCPRVDDQTVSKLVGHVCERVIASTFSNIYSYVCNEGVLKSVLQINIKNKIIQNLKQKQTNKK